MELVSDLVKVFPNGGANAGVGYLGALAATLLDYPRIIATKCCDPVRGVSRETHFLPTVADLVEWCDRETSDLRRPIDRENRRVREMNEAKVRSLNEDNWQKARVARPNIDDLRAKHGPKWGIGKAGSSVAKSARACATEAFRAGNDRIMALAEREGKVTKSCGIPISPALIESLSK